MSRGKTTHGKVHQKKPEVMKKVLSWNIERGYDLSSILSVLRNADADLIALTEVDLGCERTGNIDIPQVLAAALKMNGVWVCEFEEIKHPLRTKHLQGGFHGNLLFLRSPYKLEEVESFVLSTQFDWQIVSTTTKGRPSMCRWKNYECICAVCTFRKLLWNQW